MRRPDHVGGVVMALLLAVTSLVTLGGVSDTHAQTEFQTPVDALNLQHINVTVQEVLNDPNQYAGEQMIVTAPVENVISSRALTLASEQGAGDLLVVAPDLIMPPRSILEEGMLLAATGTLRFFDPNGRFEFQDEVGVDPESRALAPYQGEPVIVADAVTVVRHVPIELIFAQPGDTIGMTVIVASQIEQIVNSQAFTLTPRDAFGAFDQEVIDELLVVYDDRRVNLEGRLAEDALVRVTGTIREFAPGETFDFENFDTGELQDLDMAPVLVADSITVLAPPVGEVVNAILDNPEAFIGQQVAVLGTVADVMNRQAFTLEGTSGFLGLTEENLLVVGETGDVPDVLNEDALVQLRGTVQRFTPSNLDGLADLTDDPDLEAFADEPVIVADEVEVLGQTPGQTIEQILDTPSRFIGESVTVAGNVSELLGASSMTLEGESGVLGLSEDNLLVVSDNNTIQHLLVEDAVVVVEGTVAVFDEDDPAFEYVDTTDNNLDQFNGEPVIVADSITPVAVQ